MATNRQAHPGRAAGPARRSARAGSWSGVALVALLGSVAACGRCDDDRGPPSMPRVEREGRGLLSGSGLGTGAFGEGEGTAYVAGPRHVRRGEGDAPEGRRREDAVVAWVNDVTLHRSALEVRLQRRLDLARGNPDEHGPAWRNRERRRIARELVDEEMLRQHLAEQGITITDEELAAAMAEEITRVFHSDEHFERYLERRNLTREEWAENYRFELALGRLLAQRGPLQATEEQVRQYYERFRENWRASERVRASTIALRLPRDAPEETVAQAVERLRVLREQAVADLGQFDELAREHSQSPDRYRGGDLGWIYRDDTDLDPTLAGLLFGLEVGTVSEPVRTAMGVQIFVVHDHRPEGYRDFDEVRESLYDIVEQREEQSLRLSITHELEQRYEVGYNEEAFGLEPD